MRSFHTTALAGVCVAVLAGCLTEPAPPTEGRAANDCAEPRRGKDFYGDWHYLMRLEEGWPVLTGLTNLAWVDDKEGGGLIGCARTKIDVYEGHDDVWSDPVPMHARFALAPVVDDDLDPLSNDWLPSESELWQTKIAELQRVYELTVEPLRETKWLEKNTSYAGFENVQYTWEDEPEGNWTLTFEVEVAIRDGNTEPLPPYRIFGYPFPP